MSERQKETIEGLRFLEDSARKLRQDIEARIRREQGIIQLKDMENLS